ncbi:MAG: DMT family transporter [Anaerolineae bacterium]
MAAALLTPVFMGFSPIFGKLAIGAGVDAFTLSALRTCLAALLLWGVYLIFFRQFTFIFPAGVVGTMAVGVTNGLGSLLYYNALLLLNDASLAQLLFMLYVVFTMLLTRAYGQSISLLSIMRALLAMVAVYLLTTGIRGEQSTLGWIGVGLAVGAAFLYALHVVLSQRVMFEMPAPTMTLYSLTWMGLTVLLVRLIFGAFFPLPWGPALPMGWWWVAGLTVVTALSRLTLFVGVRELGSLQTILLNVGELAVTLIAAFFLLGEMLTPLQWGGTLVLLASVILSRWDTRVRDDVYKAIPKPSPLGGLPRPTGPLKPDRFSTVSRLYRRRPRTVHHSTLDD